MTIEEKAKLIIKDIKEESGVNPIRIFKRMATKEYISMHDIEYINNALKKNVLSMSEKDIALGYNKC